MAGSSSGILTIGHIACRREGDDRSAQRGQSVIYDCVVVNVVRPIAVLHTLCSKKSDAKIQITVTTVYLVRIKYPLSGFNYHLSDVNVANFNKIHHTVSEQQLFTKWNSETEVSNMENTD